MSYKNFEIKHFISNENSQMKKQLNQIWKQFMSSFGYQKYYNSKEFNLKLENIYNSTSNFLQNESSCLSSIKSLFQFLEQNSISISEKTYPFLFSNNKKGLLLLSEPKIWIMYIIFIYKKYDDENKNKNKILIIMNLFKEAIKNNCDIISLFEFFLIFISKLEYNDFSIIKSQNILDILPKEFISLYINKKTILKSIFNKENNNYINISYENTPTTIFSTDNQNKNNNNHDIPQIYGKNNEFKLDEEKNNIIQNNNICLDMNNLIIICKDYLNKGFFAIFKEKNKKGNDEEMIKNPFINNEFGVDEEDENFCLMPLLKQYQNYDEKINANKILSLIDKSIYKNYTYYPHDINIINKL